MKKLLISFLLFVFIFTGCAKDRLIYIPSKTYYPTFPTNDFSKSEKYPLTYWVEEEVEEVEGTIKVRKYMVVHLEDGLDLISHTKELRADYNLLLKKLEEFNFKVRVLNEEQELQKPIEIK